MLTPSQYSLELNNGNKFYGTFSKHAASAYKNCVVKITHTPGGSEILGIKVLEDNKTIEKGGTEL